MRRIYSSKILWCGRSTRFTIFVLLSLVLHLLLLTVRLPHPYLRPTGLTSGERIEIVSRSASTFFPSAKLNAKVSRELVEKKSAYNTRPAVSPPQKEALRTRINKIEKISTPAQDTSEVAQKSLTTESVSQEPSKVDHEVKMAASLLSPLTSSELLPWREKASGLPGNKLSTDQHQPPGAGNKTSQKAMPIYALNPKPEYPEVARLHGYTGIVELEVLVLADGRVGSVKIHTSSGFRSLDLAARKAVRFWRFQPATSLGVPIDDRVVVPISFVLEDR